MEKASGVNLEDKSGVGAPKAVRCCLTTSFWQLLRRHWCQTVTELASQTHTDKTTLQTGEDTPASPCGVDTTRGATATGYKPSFDWRKARRQGLLPTVGGILGSHWTAIARLKLGTPQTERCCTATVCYPHWGHGD